MKLYSYIHVMLPFAAGGWKVTTLKKEKRCLLRTTVFHHHFLSMNSFWAKRLDLNNKWRIEYPTLAAELVSMFNRTFLSHGPSCTLLSKLQKGDNVKIILQSRVRFRSHAESFSRPAFVMFPTHPCPLVRIMLAGVTSSYLNLSLS